MIRMTVMAGRIRESEEIMVRLLNPCMSLGNGFPINKRRRVWPPYEEPGGFRVVFVSGTMQADCTGIYEYSGEVAGRPSYRRKNDQHWLLYWNVSEESYMIIGTEPFEESMIWYSRTNDLYAVYDEAYTEGSIVRFEAF
jgi:hypothetical protein